MSPVSLSSLFFPKYPLIALATLVSGLTVGCRSGALDGSRPRLEEPVKVLSPFEQQAAAEKGEASDTVASRKDARGVFISTDGTEYPANRLVIWGGLARKLDGSPSYKSDGGVFNPRTKRWRLFFGKKVPGGVANFSIGWVAKHLMIVGGESGPVGIAAGAMFDVAGDEWGLVKEVPGGLPRVDAASLGVGDEFLIWGGCDGCRDGYVWRKTVDGWDSIDGKWNGVGSTGFGWTSMRSPKGESGELVVFGGMEKGTLLAGLVRVKASQDGDHNRYEWASASSVDEPPPRKFGLIASLGNQVMIVGGVGVSGSLTDGFLYNWATNLWSKLSLPAAVRSWDEISSLVAADGRFVLLGKSADRPDTQVSVFNPDDGSWSAAVDDNVGAPLYAFHPIVGDLHNGKIIYWGGERVVNPRYDEGTWVFEVKTRKWSPAKPD